MSDYAAWLRQAAEEGVEPTDVDWSALPDDWRTRDHHAPATGSRTEHANLVRAQVVERIIDPMNLGFADYLERQG